MPFILKGKEISLFFFKKKQNFYNWGRGMYSMLISSNMSQNSTTTDVTSANDISEKRVIKHKASL